MTEERVALLYKLASNSLGSEDRTSDLLRSYYLTRCHDITKSFGLPNKQFSPHKRCSHCCIEWRMGNYETTIHQIKLSKGQRRRARKSKALNTKKHSKEDLLNSNELQRKCLFCNHTTKIRMLKPLKQGALKTQGSCDSVEPTIPTPVAKDKNVNSKLNAKKNEINVYSSTNDVFSLANKKNAITEKKPEKVIKNNKKKKDKFAGLRMEAVLAAAKMTKTKDSENKSKLSLFLKPSK